MPRWCPACDWGVAAEDPAPVGLLARRLERPLRRAAEQLHGRLAADPGSVRAAPSRRAALALSVGVLVGALLVVGALVGWAVSLPDWWRVGVLAFLALLAWELLPRPTRLDPKVVVVTADEAPALHALVHRLADEVGVRPPAVLGLETDWNAYVVSLGWGRRQALVLGLPLWAALDPDERVGALAHELGHLRSRDTAAGRVVGAALSVLGRAATVLWPEDTGEHDSLLVSASSALGGVVQRVLAAPVVGLVVLLGRLDAAWSQHAEYVADRLAARAAGPRAVAGALVSLLGTPRGLTAAQVAARTRADPWSAIETAPRPTTRELERRRRGSVLTHHRVDDTHPPTALRLDLVARMPDAAPTALDAALLERADTELRRLREPLTRRFAEELVHGRY